MRNPCARFVLKNLRMLILVRTSRLHRMALNAQFKMKNGETFAKSSQCQNCSVSTLKAQTRVQIPLGPPTFPLIFRRVGNLPEFWRDEG